MSKAARECNLHEMSQGKHFVYLQPARDHINMQQWQPFRYRGSNGNR